MSVRLKTQSQPRSGSHIAPLPEASLPGRSLSKHELDKMLADLDALLKGSSAVKPLSGRTSAPMPLSPLASASSAQKLKPDPRSLMLSSCAVSSPRPQQPKIITAKAPSLTPQSPIARKPLMSTPTIQRPNTSLGELQNMLQDLDRILASCPPPLSAQDIEDRNLEAVFAKLLFEMRDKKEFHNDIFAFTQLDRNDFADCDQTFFNQLKQNRGLIDCFGKADEIRKIMNNPAFRKILLRFDKLDVLDFFRPSCGTVDYTPKNLQIWRARAKESQGMITIKEHPPRTVTVPYMPSRTNFVQKFLQLLLGNNSKKYKDDFYQEEGQIEITFTPSKAIPAELALLPNLNELNLRTFFNENTHKVLDLKFLKKLKRIHLFLNHPISASQGHLRFSLNQLFNIRFEGSRDETNHRRLEVLIQLPQAIRKDGDNPLQRKCIAQLEFSEDGTVEKVILKKQILKKGSSEYITETAVYRAGQQIIWQDPAHYRDLIFVHTSKR